MLINGSQTTTKIHRFNETFACSINRKSNYVYDEHMHLVIVFCFNSTVKVEWYPKRDQKVSLNVMKKDQLYAIALEKRKSILKVSLKMVAMQNGCYGNQPQPFEVVFYSIDANNSCSFTKQNLTVKQAYRASLCFVLCNEPKL